MSFKKEISILLEEYNRLHQDRRNWDNSIFQLFVLLITITAVGVTAVLEHRLQSINTAATQNELGFDIWDLVVMAYPYITYLFTLIFLILSGSISQNSTAIQHIENRINHMVDNKIMIWESTIVKNAQYKFTSTYFIASILLCAFFVVVDIYSINISLVLFEGTIYKTGYIILNSICVVALISLIIYHISFEKRITRKRLERNMSDDK